MEEFGRSTAGILKLLENLKPGKAAGPDRLKPLLLRELREEIATILQVIFDLSLQTGKLTVDWCKAQITQKFLKRRQVIGCKLQTDGLLYDLQHDMPC